MSSFLIGYGTLLLKGSLATSIGTQTAENKKYRPVIVSGYKRLFNFSPDHYTSTHKLSKKGIERAALNIEPDASTRLNAIAFEVTSKDLIALDKRERHYQRITTQICDFESGRVLREANAYSVSLDSPLLIRDTGLLLPSWRDVVWARLGAYQIGAEFGLCYDNTTYMGDGRTLVIDVYREFLKDISDVPIPR